MDMDVNAGISYGVSADSVSDLVNSQINVNIKTFTRLKYYQNEIKLNTPPFQFSKITNINVDNKNIRIVIIDPEPVPPVWYRHQGVSRLGQRAVDPDQGRDRLTGTGLIDERSDYPFLFDMHGGDIDV